MIKSGSTRVLCPERSTVPLRGLCALLWTAIHTESLSSFPVIMWSITCHTPVNLILVLGEEAMGKGFVTIKLTARGARDYELRSKYLIPDKHPWRKWRERKSREYAFVIEIIRDFIFCYYFYPRGFSPKESKEMGATNGSRRIFIDGSNSWCEDQGLVDLEMFEGLEGPWNWDRTVGDEVRKRNRG